MKQLEKVFVNAGFADVRTYINSGNVIFSYKDVIAVQTECESLIAEHFGSNIFLVVLTAHELVEALNNAPEWWGTAPDTKHNAIFVIPPLTAEAVCAEVGAIKPEYEKVAIYGKLVFWSAPVKTFSQTRWSAVFKRTNIKKLLFEISILLLNWPNYPEGSGW